VYRHCPRPPLFPRLPRLTSSSLVIAFAPRHHEARDLVIIAVFDSIGRAKSILSSARHRAGDGRVGHPSLSLSLFFCLRLLNRGSLDHASRLIAPIYAPTWRSPFPRSPQIPVGVHLSSGFKKVRASSFLSPFSLCNPVKPSVAIGGEIEIDR